MDWFGRHVNVVGTGGKYIGCKVPLAAVRIFNRIGNLQGDQDIFIPLTGVDVDRAITRADGRPSACLR